MIPLHQCIGGYSQRDIPDVCREKQYPAQAMHQSATVACTRAASGDVGAAGCP